ncbi:ABC transporter permease [Allorhizobium sp. BGMRC 0089]|uniref:ABC transporter permease n=1 Tax=Allorhizobium sonneratiae TaxID=2934936 RepID=UPI0020334D30|nr:ABC transporter permease [Allorhizobium sonneratiae]MCM2292364.1 ABC transporter permease [Allorhizobium sonneratiae]
MNTNRTTLANFAAVCTSRMIDYTPAVLLFLAVLGLWQLLVNAFNIPLYILPTPTVILTTLWHNKAVLLMNLSWTMAAAGLGFIIGSGLAIAAAILFLYSKAAERALFPWAITLKAMPILALAPLLTIWLGFGLAPKVAVAAIACFFPMLVNTVKGLRTVDRQSLEFMTVLGASKAQTFRHVRFFAALPYMFAAAKISSSIAVIGAIVAEFTGANLGIGTVIVTAGYQQDAAMLFSAIAMSSLATVMMFYLVIIAERFSLFWPDARMEA